MKIVLGFIKKEFKCNNNGVLIINKKIEMNYKIKDHNKIKSK